MNEISFERVAELRVLAHIAKVRNLDGRAFKKYLHIIHDNDGTELSAVARSAVAALANAADSDALASALHQRADQLEVMWSDAL